MTYYIGLGLILILFSMILFASYGKKKKKNGVYQTIIKKDVETSKIIVRTEIIIDDNVFDSFEETVQGIADALLVKKDAKKKGEIRYKRAKELTKK